MSRASFSPYTLFEANWLRIPDCIMDLDEDLSVRVIYGHLVRESRGTDYCWPFIKSIAKKIRVSEKTVERAIARLEALGLLEVERPDDRRDWPRTALATVETSGNRYFFLCPDWLVVDLPRPPTKTKKNTRADRLKVPSEQTLSREGTDFKSAPNRLEVPSLLIKRLNEEISDENKSLSALPSGTQPDPRPQSPEATHPHDLNKKSEDAAKDESSLDPQETHPDSSARIAPSSDFDSDALIAKGQAALRLQRAAQAAQQRVEKTQETRAKKIASRERKNIDRAQWQLDQEPVEDRKATPRGHLQKIWFAEMALAFPKAPIAKRFAPMEMGQLGNLLELYDQDHVEDAFVYVIRNWEALKQRFFKGAGGFPSLGTVLRFAPQFVPEASIWTKYRAVLEEYDAFGGKYDERPRELVKRYQQAMTALESLKLG